MSDSALMCGPRDDWHISILIPARNEEALLPRCLSSIQHARAALPHGVTSDVIVVDDGSFDLTATIAERMLGNSGHVVRGTDCIVGKARSLAAQMAIAHHRGPVHRHWLANTDADCCVPETWLVDQIAVAERNVEAVTGIVNVDNFTEHGPEVAASFVRSYLIHADGTHPHVHGANFGVRADAYLRAGGWSSLVTAEDHDLWNRLGETGARCVSLSSLKVMTSGRRCGRAPMGFAQALAAHNIDLSEAVA